jgi:hypothetical protein
MVFIEKYSLYLNFVPLCNIRAKLAAIQNQQIISRLLTQIINLCRH